MCGPLQQPHVLLVCLLFNIFVVFMICPGEIIMSISTHDWAWSRLKLIKGFPVIKTHDWGRFLGFNIDLIWIYIDLCGFISIYIDLY